MSAILNTRAIAIKIIYEIIYKNHPRESIIQKYFNQYNILNKDKDLIYNITLNTLRFKDVFDDIILLYLKKPIYKFEKIILVALESALAQIITMDKIPIYAAVSETIEAYKQMSKNIRGTNFLNYALRRITRGNDLNKIFEELKKKNSFNRRLSKEMKNEIQTDNFYPVYYTSYEKPVISIRPRNNSELLKKILEKNNIEFYKSELVPDSIIIKNTDSIKIINEILPPDLFIIQSELSQLAVYLLEIEKNDSVLDVCAGNQIKSLQIYDLTGGQADITPIDIKKIKNPKFKYIRADASKITLQREYNKILIDAPCSGLGTLPQNPEIKFRINRLAIKRFASIQYKILTNISKYLKRGGKLLYSVCTITDSETNKLIKKFVEENPQFEIIKPSMRSSSLVKFVQNDGTIKIINYNKNSFFYAILGRK